MGEGTTPFIDHYAPRSELSVYAGTINGVPIYAPWPGRSFTVTVSSDWLKANPPPDKEKDNG